MMVDMHSYNQQIKKEAREKLIRHAIDCLTTTRQDSFLVSKNHVTKITDRFNAQFSAVFGYEHFDLMNQYNWQFFGKRNSWCDFYDTICKAKTAGELKVLYLSGPEPYNDIEVLCNEGIRLENIWAIELDKGVYEKAVKSLIEANIHVKLHRGSLAEFFESTNHEFDIIYFDACSPVLSPQQSPLEILKQIFVNKRLTSLSALITNFAEPGMNYDWGEIMSTWFSCKESSEVPLEDHDLGMTAGDKSAEYKKYGQYINKHLHSYYDAFLNYFIPALGAEIIPMWQFASLGSVQNNHLLNEQALPKELKLIKDYIPEIQTANDLITKVPHYLLAVDAYPLLNWARSVRDCLPDGHILQRFIESNRKKMTIEDALYICTLLKRFEEAGTGFNTFIYNICSEKLRDTLTKLDFFDRHMGISCDIPMKNLFVELLIGLYGYPYIAHAGKSLALKYKAKETWMYSNVYVFDQCRYLYDFIPTLDLWENFFKTLPNQTIVRGCIDGIYRNHFQLNWSLFKWGFMEEAYGDWGYATLSERENLNREETTSEV